MKKQIFILFLFMFVITSILFSYGGNKEPDSKEKIINPEQITEVDQTEFFVNNIRMVVYNNCLGPVVLSGSGFLWDGTPNPQNTTIFVDGPLVGFKKDGEARVYGSKYDSGLVPGYIKDDGTYTTSEDSLSVLFELIKDWQSLPEGGEKDFYRWNYENWPARLGAPFIDNNGDGVYQPYIDDPEIKGDKMLWWTSHNMDSSVSRNVSDSFGDKLEFHGSVWGENTNFPDVVFRKYEVVNKNDYTMEDVYLSYWCDPDIGDGFDDFIGVDSTLSLAYSYNSRAEDEYFGDTPPAVGYMVVNGPVVPGNPDDMAIVNGVPVPGYKELMMSRFDMIIKGVFRYQDLNLGSEEIYYRLDGYDSYGEPVINPHTMQQTFYPLGGEPVNKTGWYEGEGWPNGYPTHDRRMIFSSGTFDLEPGEKQSFVIAILNARGSDNLNSVTKLKELAANLRYYLTGVEDGELPAPIPEEFSLEQNYPNPFNPSTKISFTIPETDNIKIEVFDILGRKVSELINTEMNAGTHSVTFNGEGLSSGMYIYKLTSGAVTETKKMMLLK